MATSSEAASRVALVTGSGRRRVGSVVAKMLADAGFSIALHYHRSESSARELVDSLRARGVTCHAFQADVGAEEQVDRMFREIAQEFGRLDLLVTTASTWESASLEDLTAQDMLNSFRVNTLGTFLCARRAGLMMVAQPQGGAIVTVGDWAVQRPYLDHAAYFVSKGAIETLTRTLAVELAHRNPRVRVNCIHPGPVLFPPECSEHERQLLIESTLTKDGDHPECIGRAVLYLAQESFVTGAALHVDGGRSIFAGEATSRKRPI